MISKPGKVLFIDTVHRSLENGLKDLGFLCVHGESLSRSEILSQLSEYQGIVLRSRLKVNAEFINAAPHLKFIARSGSGMENIDVSYAEAKGIICLNSPEGNANAVAEHCLAMLLSLCNKLPQARSNFEKGFWDRESNRGIELSGKNLGIIGFGTMGRAFAKLANAMQMNVLAFDEKPIAYAENVVPSSLSEICKTCEVISFHVDAPIKNKGLVSNDFLLDCEKSPIIINSSRGQILSIEDSIKALDAKVISGLALDVFEFENSDFSTEKSQDKMKALAIRNDIVVSPHVAGWTVESYEKLSKVLLEKIKGLIQ